MKYIVYVDTEEAYYEVKTPKQAFQITFSIIRKAYNDLKIEKCTILNSDGEEILKLTTKTRISKVGEEWFLLWFKPLQIFGTDMKWKCLWNDED